MRENNKLLMSCHYFDDELSNYVKNIRDVNEPNSNK